MWVIIIPLERGGKKRHSGERATYKKPSSPEKNQDERTAEFSSSQCLCLG